MPTSIYFSEGCLCFGGNNNESLSLATIEEFELADRCTGSIFEALEKGEMVELSEGVFELDSDLDPIIVRERVSGVVPFR